MSVVKRFSDTLVAASEAFSCPHLPELQLLPPPENPPKPDDEIPLQDLPWDVLVANKIAYRSGGLPVATLSYSERTRLQAIHGRFPPGVLLIAATTSKAAEVRSRKRSGRSSCFLCVCASDWHIAYFFPSGH